MTKVNFLRGKELRSLRTRCKGISSTHILTMICSRGIQTYCREWNSCCAKCEGNWIIMKGIYYIHYTYVKVKVGMRLIGQTRLQIHFN